MTTITVHGARPYAVEVGPGVSSQLADLAAGRLVAMVHPPTLTTVADRLASRLDRVVTIPVPDAEAAKTPQVLARCWQELAEAGLTRTDLVVGLGGGATTDLAGFLAATWMRGIDVVQVPTTVLAMADAAVGGKTGINLAAGKNLVGAFHEPLAVLCDTDLLATLPTREVRSGLAEVLKCGFIDDPTILEEVTADPAEALDVTSPTFVDILQRAIAVKAHVVAGDLRESTSHGDRVGRERLNYGHTLAHAIEAHEHFTWRHGEADSVGMVFAAELSRRTLGLADAVVDLTRSVLASVGLPTTFDEVAWTTLRDTMSLDKKCRVEPATGRRILRFVGISAPGRVTMIEDPAEDLLVECFATLAP